jgi:hypothetical protein
MIALIHLADSSTLIVNTKVVKQTQGQLLKQAEIFNAKRMVACTDVDYYTDMEGLLHLQLVQEGVKAHYVYRGSYLIERMHEE